MTNRWKSLVVPSGAMTGLALALAACQTSSPYNAAGDVQSKGPQPNFPTRMESAALNTRDTQVVAAAPPPASIPPGPPSTLSQAAEAPIVRATGSIESQPLAPLTPPPVQAAPPPPPPPPAPVYREIATGPVITVDGPPATHVVRKGDTLSSISRQMDVSVKDLQKINKLSSSNIHPGQRIKGEPTRVKAYVVQPGDTLSSIGRRFNVSNGQLTRSNNLRSNASIRPDQRLVLPSGYRDNGPQRIEVIAGGSPVESPAAPAQSTNTYARPTPPPVVVARPQQSALPSTPPARSGDLQSGRGKFIWPIDGHTIGGYGSRGPNQQSNGLDIAAAEGTEVKASAAGTVTYVGVINDDLGNLVLIDNGGGFFTAYAHLSHVDVKMQDEIRQGQAIGQVGHTGTVSEPELYFEMRHRDNAREIAKAFDPMVLLPPR